MISSYNAHTEPFFKNLKLLKIQDILTLQTLKIYHKFRNNNLPNYIQNWPLFQNSNIHNHNTRGANAFSPAYILTISPRFTVAPCVFTQRLRKTIRRINSRLRRSCVNTGGATVNRGEIVSMYAGLYTKTDVVMYLHKSPLN